MSEFIYITKLLNKHPDLNKDTPIYRFMNDYLYDRNVLDIILEYSISSIDYFSNIYAKEFKTKISKNLTVNYNVNKAIRKDRLVCKIWYCGEYEQKNMEIMIS